MDKYADLYCSELRSPAASKRASDRTPRITQRVPIREFKARLSHYLAKARASGVIEVTSHRKVVARVTGVPPDAGEGTARRVREVPGNAAPVAEAQRAGLRLAEVHDRGAHPGGRRAPQQGRTSARPAGAFCFRFGEVGCGSKLASVPMLEQALNKKWQQSLGRNRRFN